MMRIIATTPAPMAIPLVCSSVSPDLSDVSEMGCPDDEIVCTSIGVCVTVSATVCETVCVGVDKILSEQEVADGS